jgi:hypothetical protein
MLLATLRAMNSLPPDTAEENNNRQTKRDYEEMAARDLARVFFETVSEKIIIDAMPRVQLLGYVFKLHSKLNSLVYR